MIRGEPEQEAPRKVVPLQGRRRHRHIITEMSQLHKEHFELFVIFTLRLYGM